MIPYLFHIYGPLYANSYGIAIAIGILVFSYLLERDKLAQQLITGAQLHTVIFGSIIAGVIGGRLLSALHEWPLQSLVELVELWNGGFSVLGALIGILMFAFYYLTINNVPLLPLLDRAAVYAPLLQFFGRIGCFFAGCCHGTPTTGWWGVTYTHPDCALPTTFKYISIHPTQLYAAVLHLCVFLFFYFVLQKQRLSQGSLFFFYLLFCTTIRFALDFFRADQEFFQTEWTQYLSIHQWISLGIFIVASIFLFSRQYVSRTYLKVN